MWGQGSAGAQEFKSPGACMTAKANVKRGPRTDLGSITVQQNREEGLAECTQHLEERLLGAWRGWAGGSGYAHSRGSWKLFLQRWGGAKL